MALFVRTVIVLSSVLALVGGGALAAAAPADQAATATPTATAGATTTPVPCVTAPSGIVIILENPQPGDTLLTGTQVVMDGIAYDTNSASGPGISSVAVYLGDRNAGGMSLGTAVLGQPNPMASATSQLSTAGWTLRTPALPTGSGGRTIFVYAKSAVSNAEGSLQVPIFLNTAPTPVRGQVPTPVLPPPPACTPTPTATATPAATSAPVAAAATSAPVSAATPTPINVTAPLPPAPAAPAPAPAPAVQPAAPAPVTAVAPATAQTTAPRGGGIPSELGLLLLGVGAAIAAGGVALRRRERRIKTPTQ